MKARGLTPPQLQLYFENRVVDMFAGGKQLLIWEGNAGADNVYPAAANVVINVWKEEMGDLSVLEGLVRAGRRVQEQGKEPFRGAGTGGSVVPPPPQRPL